MVAYAKAGGDYQSVGASGGSLLYVVAQGADEGESPDNSEAIIRGYLEAFGWAVDYYNFGNYVDVSAFTGYDCVLFSGTCPATGDMLTDVLTQGIGIVTSVRQSAALGINDGGVASASANVLLNAVGNGLPMDLGLSTGSQARLTNSGGTAYINQSDLPAGALMSWEDESGTYTAVWSVAASGAAGRIVGTFLDDISGNYPTPTNLGAIVLAAACKWAAQL